MYLLLDPQGRGVTATEGEEADREDSDTDGKRPSDTSVDDSGSEGAETTGGQEEEEVRKRKAGALLHQFTRSSVESQHGSHHHHHPVSAIEVPKLATSGGSAGPRRSRSPGRVQRRRPKDTDGELDDF